MAKFTDSAGTTWEVRIVVPMLPRLRAVGYDLAKVGPETIEGLVADPERLGQILGVVCADQAEKLDLAPEAFAARFDGPTIFGAVDAMLEATADFTQRPAVAAAIKAKLPGALERIDRATIARVEASLEKTIPSGSTAGATNSPGSPASPPSG